MPRGRRKSSYGKRKKMRDVKHRCLMKIAPLASGGCGTHYPLYNLTLLDIKKISMRDFESESLRSTSYQTVRPFLLITDNHGNIFVALLIQDNRTSDTFAYSSEIENPADGKENDQRCMGESQYRRVTISSRTNGQGHPTPIHTPTQPPRSNG